jgi:hypothetical protein
MTAQNHPVDGQHSHATGPVPSQHDDLLTQHKDPRFHRCARPEQVDHMRNNQSTETPQIIRFCVLCQPDGFYDRDRFQKYRVNLVC